MSTLKYTAESQKKNVEIAINGRVVGVVDGRVLRVIKSKASHTVRKFNGVGISPETLEQAQRLGCEVLELQFFDTLDRYQCLISEYIKWGIPENLGAGKQLFLSYRSFKYSVLNHPQATEQTRNVQIGMFD